MQFTHFSIRDTTYCIEIVYAGWGISVQETAVAEMTSIFAALFDVPAAVVSGINFRHPNLHVVENWIVGIKNMHQ